jgi:hypothetical protein
MSDSDSEYDSPIARGDFFQKTQIWPLNQVLNYRGWIKNFSTEGEKEIAGHILNFFMFYPDAMIDQMLRAVIGYCGEYLVSSFSDWQHDDFKKRCIYSFIPGETENPTDSGYQYARKLRNVLGIPEERIVDYRSLYFLLENSNGDNPVIFVDDFVGSGAQCDKAWNKNKGGIKQHTLSDIASISSHKFIYAPLISNYTGYDRIKQKCHGLTLVTCHKLDQEYNLFDPSCICWNNDTKLFTRGIELILNKSKEQGIPFTGGKCVVDAKGFGEQGLALSFDNDGVPDAIPALFYWCSDKWTPLIRKDYKR